MNMLAANIPISTELSTSAFRQIQTFFYKESGIFLPDHKRPLVISRLRGRLESIGLQCFDAYCQYLAVQQNEQERRHVVDLLTTNETYFFREPNHFKVLAEMMIPAVSQRPLRLWCAAASSGEEPYSLAMVLADKLGANAWDLVASDLSKRVLEKARQGIYRMQRMENMPPEYLKDFCRKGTGDYEGMLIVDQGLRNRVHFVQHNLLDSAAKHGQFDIIFVRNVMIYFDAEIKRRVLSNLVSQLRPRGWLVISHSESLLGSDIPLEQVMPSVYRRIS
jgi:chemotaxis protein methyltransferase CheR